MLAVIACDKREAFAQGSTCDEAIHSFPSPWIASLTLAMTVQHLRLSSPAQAGDPVFQRRLR
jgi:hypothetical protein